MKEQFLKLRVQSDQNNENANWKKQFGCRNLQEQVRKYISFHGHLVAHVVVSEILKNIQQKISYER